MSELSPEERWTRAYQAFDKGTDARRDAMTEQLIADAKSDPTGIEIAMQEIEREAEAALAECSDPPKSFRAAGSPAPPGCCHESLTSGCESCLREEWGWNPGDTPGITRRLTRRWWRQPYPALDPMNMPPGAVLLTGAEAERYRIAQAAAKPPSGCAHALEGSCPKCTPPVRYTVPGMDEVCTHPSFVQNCRVCCWRVPLDSDGDPAWGSPTDRPREMPPSEPTYVLSGAEMVAYARMRAAAFQAHAAQQAHVAAGQALRDAMQAWGAVVAPGKEP